ncbi:hypothetical protein [Saccharopolyspora gregorii]|uniref:SnoaL-like domain-containing protein n=1 Tax=Saccharopolyspora gregorii TaxID=33914 RepID=A0ABP6RZB9_9PSEU
MTDIETDLAHLAQRWCHMWNARPESAHELLTPDARQWSGKSPGLDDLVGPEPAVGFIRRWAIDPGPRFAVRLLAADRGERLAYTWDATLPDATVLSGMDVNVLVGGKVAENWTIAGDRRVPGPDPAPRPASADRLREIADGWVGPEPAGVLGPDVVLRSALAEVGDVEGGAAVRDLLSARGPRAVHREPVVDPERGAVAVLWTADDGATGIEFLVVRDDRVVEVRSYPANRPFHY